MAKEQKTETTARTNVFKRTARVGINPMSIEEGETIYITVQSDKVETMQLKKQKKPTPFVNVTNLETGEEGTFWLSGSLNYQFTELSKENESLKGMSFEIIHKGKKRAVVNGEETDVNQYDMYEIDPTNAAN